MHICIHHVYCVLSSALQLSTRHYTFLTGLERYQIYGSGMWVLVLHKPFLQVVISFPFIKRPTYSLSRVFSLTIKKRVQFY